MNLMNDDNWWWTNKRLIKGTRSAKGEMFTLQVEGKFSGEASFILELHEDDYQLTALPCVIKLMLSLSDSWKWIDN